ncbi:MAG: hypothetical protein RL217_457 [Pseudomonadota bacterium]
MLRHLRIGLRATLFFSLLGLIVLLSGLFSITQLKSLHESAAVLGMERMPRITQTGMLRVDYLNIRLTALSLLSAESDKEKQDILAQLQSHNEAYQKKFQELSELTRSSEAKALLTDIAQSKQRYDDSLKAFIKHALANDLRAANEIRRNQLYSESAIMLKSLAAFVSFQNEAAKTSIHNNEQQLDTAIKSLTAAIVLTLLAIAVMAYFFSKSLTLPLHYAVTRAQLIAQGNLNQGIHDDGKDEASEMVQALGQMQQGLRETVSTISSAAEQLATTAEELNGVTNDASRTVQEQSNQLEMAATAVNELTAAIDEVANSASTASDVSQEVNNKAQIGQAKLESAIATIEKLVREIGETTTGISTLASNVGSISSVIDVIRAIAEQTNLLALNAAIEAARAGEQGRGFAVVADEVRSLAGRTQESTKEIERMIGNVQSATEHAVKQMENSNQWAQSTIAETRDLGEALGEVTRLIEQINAQNLNIASAAEEQATVAREVDKNLVSIRDLSHQTATGATQTNASSQELARLAEGLNTLLQRFKL